MNIKQKLIIGSLVLLFGAALSLVHSPAVFAQEKKKCAGVETSLIECPGAKKDAKNPEDSGVWALLILALNIMTAGVGILAVGGIVYGSVLYTSAADSAEQTAKAKEIIRNVIIGIVAYGLMYVGLNYLVPGGIFT